MLKENPVSLALGLVVALLIDYFLWGPLLGALFLGDALPEVPELLRLFFWVLFMAFLSLAMIYGVVITVKRMLGQH